MNKLILKSIGSDIIEGSSEIIKEYDFMMGEELLFVLPNYSVLKEAREELVNSLGAINNSILNTFDDLANRFSEEKLYLEKSQAMLVIKKIISENISLFDGTRLNENNHQDIANYIFDLKAQGIEPDTLINQDDLWELNLLGQIYKKYEKKLEEKQIDDDIGKYISALNNISKQTNKGKLYINGFIEFRPVETRLIQAFANSGYEIEVTYPFVMARNNKKLEKTIESFREMGFEIIKDSEIVNSRSYYYLDQKFNEVKTNEDNIEIIAASDKFLEVDGVFKSIRKKLKNIDARDISIISGEEYSPIINLYSEKYDIPVSSMNQLEAKKLPLVKGAINLLELVYSKDKNKLISFLENKYFNSYQLESKFSIVKELRQINYQGLFVEYKNISDGLEGFLKYTRDLVNYIDENPAKNFLEFLSQSDLRGRLIENFEKHGDLNLLKTSMNSINIIEEIADNIFSLSKIINLDSEECLEAMIESFNDYKYYSDNQIEGIKVLPAINAIGTRGKIRYIMGMDQSYPKKSTRNYLYSTRFLEFYEKIGFNVEDKYEDLDNEIIKFASSLSGTSLVFTYSYGESELKDKKSFLLDKFLLSENNLTIYDCRSLIDSQEFGLVNPKDKLLGELFDRKSNELKIDYLDSKHIDELNHKFSKYLKKTSKDLFYWGNIESEKNSKLIIESKITSSYSPSMINLYYSCPYQFYLKYLIGLEELLMEYDDKFNLEKGINYHEILNEFFENNSNYKEMNDEFIGERLLNILDNKLNNEELDFEIKRSIYFNYLFNFIKEDIKFYSAIEGDFKPKKFEEKLYTRVNGINISGRVDRIDEDSDGRKIIFDYKSSSAPSMTDVLNLKELQIPIYMLLAGSQAFGGLYGVIEKPYISKPYLLDEILKKKKKTPYGMEELRLSMESLTEKIEEIDEMIKRGQFVLDSSEEKVCRLCEFKDICMKEDWSDAL